MSPTATPESDDESPEVEAARADELAGLNEALRREVTERKRFEDELRRSEHFLSAVLGALPSRVAVLDEKGTIIAVNTAWERSVGSDSLGSLVSGLGANYLAACESAVAAGSEEAAALLAGVRQMLSGELETFAQEYPSDKGYWHALRITAFDSAGHRRLVLLLEDISQRKEAEDALLQSMHRTQLVLDSAVDGIITIDDRGLIESMNPAAEHIFGYSADELLGRNIKALMPPPYEGEHDDYIRHYLSTGERKIIGIGREVVGRRKDGSTFPMDLAVSEFHLGGKRSFMGSVRDITDRKEVDEALRRERDFAESLVETAQAIVLVLDTHGRILRFNRYLEEISGFRLDDVRGHDWFDTFLPEAERGPQRGLFAELLAGRPRGERSGPIVTRSGGERQIEWAETTLEAADGSVVGVLWTGQDVTDRIDLEAQLRHVQKMEAIGRLAGGVAHDFNTLLGAIIGYSEILLDKLDEGDSRRQGVEQIYRGAQRGAGLTRQLLAFSRRQVLQPKVVDLNGVVADMDNMIRRLIGENIELEYELDAELWTVEVDTGQIEQVVMNLVVNAADALSARGWIVLATANRPGIGGGADQVALVVRDNGCGMDEAVRSRVFDPFFTTKEQGKGTGLGLSTVYGIVRQSGGSITVESELGQGTTFEVVLPRVEGKAESSAIEPPAPVQNRGSETVLLVEDDEMFRELLTDVLEASGYQVLAASEPQMALELCSRETTAPQMLISDLVMPGMSGTDLAQQLVEQHPEMRVLLMSGYSDEALEDRGVLASGHAFLQKPFSTRDFIRTVHKVLETQN